MLQGTQYNKILDVTKKMVFKTELWLITEIKTFNLDLQSLKPTKPNYLLITSVES